MYRLLSLHNIMKFYIFSRICAWICVIPTEKICIIVNVASSLTSGEISRFITNSCVIPARMKLV